MVEKLLNAHQVAEILGVSKSKAFSLIQRGEIPVVRIERNVRVREIDLQQYIFDHLSGNSVSFQKDQINRSNGESGTFDRKQRNGVDDE